MGAHLGMPDGDNTRTMAALRRLRQRWLAPSPPLAVDDDPHPGPAADSGGEPAGRDGETDRPGPAPAAN